MKRLLYILILIYSLPIFSQVNIQTIKKDTVEIIQKDTLEISKSEGVDIDPRQFVEIFELNRQKNEIEPIYRNDSILINTIDINSLIEIHLDRDLMIKSTGYYGNVSLVAEINEEPIKVSPYSEVGEKQSEIGVNTASPDEVSRHFISMIDRTKNLNAALKNIMLLNQTSKKGHDPNSINLPEAKDLDYIIEYYSYYDNKEEELEYKSIPEGIQLRMEKFIKYNAQLLLFKDGEINLNAQTLKIVFKNLEEEDRIKSYLIQDEIKDDLDIYYSLKSNIELTNNYLDYFQNTNDEELATIFLRLIKLDKLTVEKLSKQLDKCLKKLNEKFEDADEWNNSFYADKELKRTIEETHEIVRFYHGKLTDLKLTKDGTTIDENKLAIKIGQLIYQKLFVGKADLRTSRAQQGQILTLSVLWYKNNEAKAMKLEIASFRLKEVGWRTKISDSFLLINRYSTPKNDENVSPSNFKGSPGVTLMRTFGNYGSKDLFNRIEPSIGINVSYLDFYENKDLEVGVGVIVGFFKNQIFFTLGHNLHSETQGGYIGLGFSFANIAGQLQK